MLSSSQETPAILHICRREILRPLRDEILRLSGYHVDSTLDTRQGFNMLRDRPYDLVLVDVEGERGIQEAEQLCSDIKTSQHAQKVAFVCNWRVASLTDCPDEIIRTEFNPDEFVRGVMGIVPA